jgi:F-type H+-transporting ATPase subunit b
MVEEAKTAVEAVSPLARLGVDWRLLVAQLVNFGIVLFVMAKWVYKPLLKVMDERAAKIEQGLKDAAAAAVAKATADSEKDVVVTEARQRARAIVEEAEALALSLREEQVKKAKTEVESIVAKGKEQLTADRAASLAAAKAELADLVVAAASKVIGTKMDSAADAALAKAALTERR